MPAFERIAVTLRFRNDLMTQVQPHGGAAEVTVPEYMLLEHLHGEGSVIPEKAGEPIERLSSEEYERLSRTYDIVSNYDNTGKGPTARLFPAKNNLPSKFGEIGVKTNILPKIKPDKTAKADANLP